MTVTIKKKSGKAGICA